MELKTLGHIKPLYAKIHEKLTQNKAYQRRLVKRRSSTVEPVLGTLINFFNMKRIKSGNGAGKQTCIDVKFIVQLEEVHAFYL